MNLGFLGEHEYKIDAKGRLAIPKTFIENLPLENGEPIRKLVIFGMMEDYLLLYSVTEWSKFAQPILSSNPFDRIKEQQIRKFSRYVSELDLDGQNRITLPKRLTELASITKEVILVGVTNKIELWDKAAYQKVMQNNSEQNLDEFGQFYADYNGGGTPRAK